jgi:hypothetical protein
MLFINKFKDQEREATRQGKQVQGRQVHVSGVSATPARNEKSAAPGHSPDERLVKRAKLFAKPEAFPTPAFYRISG